MVSRANLFVLVQARDLDAPEYRIPPESLASLPDGTPLFWRVTAYRPDGTTISSRTLRVSVR
jgi:hypothetical protein